MNFNVLIEVALGLIAIYFLLAIACSFVIEAINSFTNVRGRALAIFVTEMVLGDRKPEEWVKGAIPMTPWWTRNPITALFTKLADLADWMKSRFSKSATEPPGQPAQSTAIPPLDMRLLDHPLVRSLRKPATDMGASDTAPSYIPAGFFSKALLDRIATWIVPLAVPRAAVEAFSAALATADSRLKESAAALEDVLRKDSAQTVSLLAFLHKLLDRLNESDDAQIRDELIVKCRECVNQRIPGPEKAVFSAVLAAFEDVFKDTSASRRKLEIIDVLNAFASKLTPRALTFEALNAIVHGTHLPDQLAQSLRAIARSATYDLNEVRTGVEHWYDGVMDRATGWFKRRATVLLGVCGFFVAAAFNIDTFDIAAQLFRDPEARAAGSQLGRYLASVPPEQAYSVPQKAMFAAAYKGRNWNQERLADPAGAKTSIIEGWKSVAAQAQPLLMFSGEPLGPMMALQALAREASPSPDLWRDVVDAMAGSACRSRLSRLSPEERAANKYVAHAFNLKPAELIQDHLCASEATAIGRKPSAATGTPASAAGTAAVTQGKAATGAATAPSNTMTVAAEMPKEVPDHKRQICKFWEDPTLALSWAPTTAKEAWSLIAAEKNGKLACNADVELNTDEGHRFKEALGNAAAESEKTREQVVNFLDRLPNVGFIAKPLPTNWWRSCGPFFTPSNARSDCPKEKRVSDLTLAIVAILLGIWLLIYMVRSGRRGNAKRTSFWLLNRMLVGMAIAIAVVLMTGYLDYPFFQVSSVIMRVLWWLLLGVGVCGVLLALAEAWKDETPVSVGSLAFFLLLLLALVPIFSFGAYNIAHEHLLASISGWAVTGMMISYGAPFWYELLNKLVNQRVTGPKPEPRHPNS